MSFVSKSGTKWDKTKSMVVVDGGFNDRLRVPEEYMAGGCMKNTLLPSGSEGNPAFWCARACDSFPGCDRFSVIGNDCYIPITGGRRLVPRGDSTAYVRSSDSPALPDGVSTNSGYVTRPLLDTDKASCGAHSCRNSNWDCDGIEISRWHDETKRCVERFPRKSRAPAELGEFSKSAWYDVVNGQNKYDDFPWNTLEGPNVGLRFWYNSIPVNILFDEPKMDQYFSGPTKVRARREWCNSSSRTVTDLDAHSSDCITAITQRDYDNKLLGACGRLADWTLVTPCIRGITGLIRNPATGTNDNTVEAQRMVAEFCAKGDSQDGPGPRRSSALCGCMNAYDFGYYNRSTRTSNCFTPGYENLPGCTEITEKARPIVSLMSDPTIRTTMETIFTDEGKFTDYCFRAQGGGSTNFSVLPYKSEASFGQGTVIMNLCQQISQTGLSMNSSVRQACNINTNVTVDNSRSVVVSDNAPGGTAPGGATSGGTTSGGTTSGGNAPGSTAPGDAPGDASGFLALAVLFCCCFIIIITLALR